MTGLFSAVFADRPTAVYRFYDDAERLLYVGITHSLGTRFNAHERTASWWRDQHAVKIVWRATRDEAAAEERMAIREEKPLHNISGTREPKVRVRDLRPDRATCEAIGLEVRVAIARSGKSKREVREYVGLSRQSMWERVNGRIPFSDDELQSLAELFGVPVSTFFAGVPAVTA